MKEIFTNQINIKYNLINFITLLFIILIFSSKIINSLYVFVIFSIIATIYIIYQRELLVNRFYLIFICITIIYIIASYLNLFNSYELIYNKSYIIHQSIVFFIPLIFINIFRDINHNILKNYKLYFFIYLFFLLIYFLLKLIYYEELSFAILNGSLTLSILGLVLITYYINSDIYLNSILKKTFTTILIIFAYLFLSSTTQSFFYFAIILLIFIFKKEQAKKITYSILIIFFLLFFYSLLTLTLNPDYNYSSLLIRARFFYNDFFMILNSNLFGNGLGTYNIFINYDAPIRAIFERPQVYDFFLVNSHNMFTHVFQKFGFLGFIFFSLFFFYDLRPKTNEANIKINYTIWFILIINTIINPSFYAVDNVIGLYFLIAALSNENNLIKIKF